MDNSYTPLDLTRLILFTLITSLLIISISLPDIPNTKVDAPNYIKAAENGPSGIIRPHGTRFLLPAIVRSMKPVINVHKGFFLMGTLSLMLFIMNVLIILNLYKVPLLFGSIILLNPLLVTYYSQYYIPDLFFMALLSTYFIILHYDKQYMASLFLVLLFLTRETAIILSIGVIIVSIYHNRKKQLFLTIVATVIGLMGITAVKQYSGTNIWGASEFVYLMAKVPSTIMRNSGFGLYSNIVPYCEPMFTISLPTKLHIGNITTVGICKWNPIDPTELFIMLFTLFGIGPIILFNFIYKKLYKQILENNFLMVVFSYGFLIYLMGFIISSDRLRVIGYGWPVFWLIIPIWLFFYKSRKDINDLNLLLIIHFIICWLPFMMLKINHVFQLDTSVLLIYLIVLFISLLLYIISWNLIKNSNLFKLTLKV